MKAPAPFSRLSASDPSTHVPPLCHTMRVRFCSSQRAKHAGRLRRRSEGLPSASPLEFMKFVRGKSRLPLAMLNSIRRAGKFRETVPYGVQPPVYLCDFIVKDAGGWGARIRTWGWRYQKPLPYRLATPQYRLSLVGGSLGLMQGPGADRRRADSGKMGGHQALFCLHQAILAEVSVVAAHNRPK